MPPYIKLCMKTWKFDYTVLNYDNLNDYTSLDILSLQKFTLPQVADIVRVHVLRDNGGYWIDTDTIMLKNELPKENMIGNPVERTQTIGYLYTPFVNDPLFVEWAKFQDNVIQNKYPPFGWNAVGNAFTDTYVKEHKEVTIADVTNCWAETYMISGDMPRWKKYGQFYFEQNYHKWDLRDTNMLMLHNSWTPCWYKRLSESEVLGQTRTLSNILKELL